MKIKYLFIYGWITAAALPACNSPSSNPKPNVILISVDDLRPELGCYGNTEIKTPHIDDLAQNSIIFTSAYCQAAACAPSRASLMTGLRPDANRVWHLGDKFREINPDIVTIPQYFNGYGYYTVSMGKIFHNHMPDSVSFDEPDLRPDEYKTADMIDRDPESFYYDEGIREEHRAVREERIKRNPNAYAGGWAYGRATECSDVPDEAFYNGAQTNLALETLERLKEKEQPFFLALGYYRPHLPFVAPKKYWDLYNREELSMASNPYLPENSPVMAMNSSYELMGCYDIKNIRHPSIRQVSEDTARLLKHGYYASVSYVDACIGKLMDGISDLGLDENTIIIIYGDHGWKLGEHGSWCKQTNYDIDTRVPFIIRTPASIKSGNSCDRLVELLDIFPTLCDLAGLEIPEYLQGTSIKPLLADPETKWKSAAFCQFHRRPRISPDGNRYMGYSMTTREYHYVEWYFWDNENKSLGDLEAVELYDRISDPDENINIGTEEKYKPIIIILSKQMNAGLADEVVIEVNMDKTKGPLSLVWSWFGHDETNYTCMKEGKKDTAGSGSIIT